MKILMLGWELPPHNSGGLGVACYQLCKHLALEGVEIDFVVPYRSAHPNITFMNVVAATECSPEHMQAMMWGAYDSAPTHSEAGSTEWSHTGEPRSLREQQMRYAACVQQLASEQDYDVIHAHDWLTYEAGLAAKKELNVPLIAHVHATEFDRAGGGSGSQLVHEIEYQGLVMADQIVAVSHATKRLIVERYAVPADSIEVMHNSIDPAEFTELPQPSSYTYVSHMKAQGYAVLASVGRLTLQKGLRFLLEAVQTALAHNPKILLVVAGSGEQYRELIEVSADLGIARNVLFTGFVRGAAWRDIFGLADMFVMPSVSEPFGLVALEAAGYGNAVLISRQSGVGEVLQHVLRFDFWDTDRLASQIVALADSEALRDELRHNSAHEFQHLSWSKVAQQCVDLYTKVRPAEAVV